MKILFLSNTRGKLYSGPSYSIPAQVTAQSKHDEVVWYNSVISEQLEWNSLPYYHDVEEIPDKKLKTITEKFGRPDIIVIEQFYNHIKDPYLYEVYRSGIPYVIIPRGEFTKKGQQRSGIKKKIINLFVSKKIIRKAAAVWYLTEQERYDAGTHWNLNSLVIPNGISIPNTQVEYNTNNIIKFVNIGRLEPYQKGLDILIDAIERAKARIFGRCHFDLYGADVDGKAKEFSNEIVKKGITSLIEVHGPAYGQEKEKLLLSSDVFIMTSRFEGHPMALLEAMAYGLPCIVSQGSNMLEQVDIFGAGWTFDLPEKLDEVIVNCVNKTDEYKEKGIHAIMLAQEYDWDHIAETTHNILGKLMNPPETSRRSNADE